MSIAVTDAPLPFADHSSAATTNRPTLARAVDLTPAEAPNSCTPPSRPPPPMPPMPSPPQSLSRSHSATPSSPPVANRKGLSAPPPPPLSSSSPSGERSTQIARVSAARGTTLVAAAVTAGTIAETPSPRAEVVAPRALGGGEEGEDKEGEGVGRIVSRHRVPSHPPTEHSSDPDGEKASATTPSLLSASQASTTIVLAGYSNPAPLCLELPPPPPPPPLQPPPESSPSVPRDQIERDPLRPFGPARGAVPLATKPPPAEIATAPRGNSPPPPPPPSPPSDISARRRDESNSSANSEAPSKYTTRPDEGCHATQHTADG